MEIELPYPAVGCADGQDSSSGRDFILHWSHDVGVDAATAGRRHRVWDLRHHVIFVTVVFGAKCGSQR